MGGHCLEICSKSAGLQDSQISDDLYSGQAMEGSLGCLWKISLVPRSIPDFINRAAMEKKQLILTFSHGYEIKSGSGLGMRLRLCSRVYSSFISPTHLGVYV